MVQLQIIEIWTNEMINIQEHGRDPGTKQLLYRQEFVFKAGLLK
jgi:hypothetical protein